MTTKTNEAKAAGARKGHALRRAREEAARTGQDVMLGDYGLLVKPDGSVHEGTMVGRLVTDEEILKGARPLHPVAQSLAEVVRPVVDNATGGALTELQQLLAKGLSEDDALTLIMAKRGKGEVQRPRDPGTPEAPASDQQGPDPALVAAYHEKMKNYVPPKSDETFSVKLPVRYADYLRRCAAVFSVQRNEEISPERAIELIIRRAKQLDQVDAIWSNPTAKTGPAQAFNPVAQQWKP